jgi:thiol-disulfide isomerase/thioredoxin
LRRWRDVLIKFVAPLWLCAGLAHAEQPLPELTHALTRVDAKPAPELVYPDLEGKSHKLSDYRGKVVLVNFWATWCPPCRREMPSMERLHQILKDQPFAILAIDQQEDADTVFAFTAQLDPEPTFPLLLDPKSLSARAYGVKGLPVSVIIDKQGNIVYRAVGGREFDHPELIAMLRALIAAP